MSGGCKCRERIEEQLKERHISKTPKSRGHRVNLQGYAIVFDSECGTRPYMPYETFEYAPLVKGGEKPKKTKGNMFFSYCPFCGAKLP